METECMTGSGIDAGYHQFKISSVTQGDQKIVGTRFINDGIACKGDKIGCLGDINHGAIVP